MERTSARRPHASTLYAAAGLLATSVYLLVGSEVAQAALFESVAASAVLAVLVGLRLRRPRHSAPWAFIAAGLTSFVAGEVTWDIYDLGFGQDPFPSPADAFYLAGYPLVATGIYLLVRGRGRSSAGARGSAVDAGIVTIAASVVSWIFLIDPYAGDASLGLLERSLSVSYPLMDLLLLALLASLVFAQTRKPAAFWLLAMGIACNVLADTVFAAAEVGSGYATGLWLDTVWLIGYVAFGAAALHPDMASLEELEPRTETRLTPLRLGALAAASVTTPTVLGLEAARGDLTSVPMIVAGAALLPLLALVRMAGLLHELERANAERKDFLLKERIARAEAESAHRLLLEQNGRLRELDHLKDEFVALVSHELRTPLTSITGYLELVMEDTGELADEQRRFLKIVERNSRRLLRVVDDLLFVAQIESGKLALELEDVELAAVAAESVEAARPAAEGKEIEVVLETQPLPLVRGDRARLGQLLDNLVSNAVKFTAQGGRVLVTLGQLREDALVTVTDTGIGIPQSEQRHLFERFFRSSSAQERAIGGTGLGLAIARAIVQAHGGGIDFASTEGEGTTFRVRLPLTGAAVAEGAAEETRARSVI
jgi:signal transduction histidine kinase